MWSMLICGCLGVTKTVKDITSIRANISDHLSFLTLDISLGDHTNLLQSDYDHTYILGRKCKIIYSSFMFVYIIF